LSLSYVIGDGTVWHGSEWLLLDSIVNVRKTLERRWCDHGWCRRFVKHLWWNRGFWCVSASLLLRNWDSWDLSSWPSVESCRSGRGFPWFPSFTLFAWRNDSTSWVSERSSLNWWWQRNVLLWFVASSSVNRRGEMSSSWWAIRPCRQIRLSGHVRWISSWSHLERRRNLTWVSWCPSGVLMRWRNIISRSRWSGLLSSLWGVSSWLWRAFSHSWLGWIEVLVNLIFSTNRHNRVL
jgi:hypothetical protein